MINAKNSLNYWPYQFGEILQCYNITISMEQSSRKSNKPKKYAKVSHEERKKLVTLIEMDRLSIAKAARVLSIKLSTAKLIWTRYRTDGTFFQKQADRKTRLTQQDVQQNSLEEEQGFNPAQEKTKEKIPESSLIMEDPIQPFPSKILDDKTQNLGSNSNSELNCYWLGYAYYLDISPNWCYFY